MALLFWSAMVLWQPDDIEENFPARQQWNQSLVQLISLISVLGEQSHANGGWRN
ncbi:hypothetical protein [Cylindrospermum sp. FACHB-282]|uniref:hypothetical protein n=1 Tax=Cylindrospermum sp. FACHB-282 TaxID=2692794 RepID=UPI001686F2F7|nr:hypothetical protein [Cylindrospermum sp. FACHB-282]MBD2388656.1 hypothetical protein [Cylindrospermum sp. FACHB-282]